MHQLLSIRLKMCVGSDIVYESNYMIFGPGYGEEGSEGFRYTGKHTDHSVLRYFEARYYDPDTGGFITEDSKLGNIEALPEPQQVHILHE